MKKIILCNHTGSHNRGCDAIIKSTADLFSEINVKTILAEHMYKKDQKFGYSEFEKVVKYSEFQTAPISRCLNLVFNKLLKKEYIGAYWRQKEVWNILKGNLALNVGGDTYCYGRHVPSLMLNEYCYRNSIPSVLWGCSIEKKIIEDPEILNDLKKYSLIVTRETLTYNYLIEAGIEENKIFKAADPAFTLKPSQVELPNLLKKYECVCINLSPLVQSLSFSDSILLDNIYKLIDYILENTEYGVLLVPHVYTSGNFYKEDLKSLFSIFSKYKHCKKIELVSDFYTSRELKYIISKCKYAVVARTHASIAAYSSGVPTIVLGYSVKSLGIARDLFGTADGYVIPVQSLSVKNQLLEAFFNIERNNNCIRQLLTKKTKEFSTYIRDAVSTIVKM